jgi:SAM-dependent methyltransferase
MFGLMFFPDRGKGYAELLRVLVPGGVAVVSSWAPVSDSPLMQLMFGALRAADPTRPEPRYDPESLENPTVLATELAAAGFDEVTVVRHTVPLAFDGAEDLFDRMVRSSAPLVMLRRKLGEEVWAEQSAKALAFIQDSVRSGTREASTTALLGVGRKPLD